MLRRCLTIMVLLLAAGGFAADDERAALFQRTMGPGTATDSSADPVLRELPQLLDPYRLATVDRHTLFLWHFEADEAKAALPFYKNPLEQRGQPTPVAGGRFGRAMALHGGADTLRTSALNGLEAESSSEKTQAENAALTLDFWLKLPEPLAPGCLLELGPLPNSREPVLTLQVAADARLCLTGRGLPATVAETPLPLGRWLHLTVRQVQLYQAERVYLHAVGVEILVNGHRYLRALAPTVNYAFPGPIRSLTLGNTHSGDAGLVCHLDAVRGSNLWRGIVPWVEQAWRQPTTAGESARQAPWFRYPARQVFSAHWDQPAELSAVLPPVKPRPLETLPELTVIQRQLSSGQAATEVLRPKGGDDDLFELAPDDKPAVPTGAKVPATPGAPQSPALQTLPGVRGHALSVHGGRAGLLLPAGVDLSEQGSIEFWFMPGNWDNFGPPTPRDSPFRYALARPSLLELWGVPKTGTGAPAMMLSVGLSRQGGGVEVMELVDSYFGLPKLPLHPTRWRHLAIVWGAATGSSIKRNIYLDGELLPYDVRLSSSSLLKDEQRQGYQAAWLALGNEFATAYDELRVYNYCLSAEEIRNAIALITGTPPRPLPAASASFDYRYTPGELHLALQANLPGAQVARYSLSGPGLAKPLSGELAFSGEPGPRVSLAVGQLSPGTYTLTGAVLDAAGRELGSVAGAYQMPDLPWLNNRLGLSDTPPPPFEAVTRQDQVVSAVGRRYTLGTDGHFSQIEALGQPLLASPISLVATVAGQSQPLLATGACAFGATTPHGVSWQASSAGTDLRVAVAVQFEYDGMAKYTLDLQPGAAGAKLERLTLRIPLRQEAAEYLHALPVTGDFRAYQRPGTGALPRLQQGLLWDSQSFYANKKAAVSPLPLGNFMSVIWLGGALRGLFWFADNDRGWLPSDAQPAVTLSRAGEVVTLELHFISEPVLLKEPRQIVYGLLATPPKPLPADGMRWNRSTTKEAGSVANSLTSCDAFAPPPVPLKGEECMAYWPIGYDWDFVTRGAEVARTKGGGKYTVVDGLPNRPILLYHDKRFVPVGEREAAFRREWVHNGQISFPPTLVDCLIWYMDQWLGRRIVQGLYIDDTFPVADYNWESGSAYKLPDGRVQPGSHQFAYREYLKRLYGVFHAHGLPPIITVHATHSINPYMAFATFNYDGEDGWGFSKDNSFIDAWPLDRLITLDIAERTGLLTAFILKSDYLDNAGMTQEKFPHRYYRVYRSAWACYLLFNFNQAFGYGGAGPSGTLAETLRRYQQPDTKLLPFWRNEAFVTIAPLPKPITDPVALPKAWTWTRTEFRQDIGRQPFRATLYRQPRRALLIVTNFLRQPATARVTLAWERLGLSAEQRQALKIVEVDDWLPPEGEDILKMKKPEAPGAVALDDAGTAMGELDRLDAPLAPGQQGFELAPDGTLILPLRTHDFRALELSW